MSTQHVRRAGQNVAVIDSLPIRKDAYPKALARLLDHQLRLPLAAHSCEGTHGRLGRSGECQSS